MSITITVLLVITSVLLVLHDDHHANAFLVQQQPTTSTKRQILQHHRHGRQHSSSSNVIRRYNFFKDVLGKAFENDSTDVLSSIEGPTEGEYDPSSASAPAGSALTATQQKWQRLEATPRLDNTMVEVDFYLTGVPNKDPSNDLFGSRVNVSSRDRQVGLSVPDQPTVNSVRIEFLPSANGENNKCRCLTDTAFTASMTDGDYRVSDDGKQVRFRIPCNGYTRTIETKGTINKIYWSNEDDETRETSTTYSIQEGWIYGEADLSSNAKGIVQWNNGVLKIERTMGLLGAGSKMTACGKFTARAVIQE